MINALDYKSIILILSMSLFTIDHFFFFRVIAGLEILAFPCNQFLQQQPGTSQEAQEFACTRYKAEYPIFQKVIRFFLSLSWVYLNSILDINIAHVWACAHAHTHTYCLVACDVWSTFAWNEN